MNSEPMGKPACSAGGKCSAGFGRTIRKPARLAAVREWLPAMVPLVACVLLLGGCVHSTKARFTRHYGLGPAPTAPHRGSLASGAKGKILEVAQISVPEWLSGNAMYYRLDYRNDDRLAAYAQSDWIAPPASLLQPILRQSLAGRGWRAVVGPRNPANADASLQLRLDDFSQAFAQPGASKGVLDATATLIDSHDDHVIAQKRFHVEVPAATADAQGGARALAEASRRFAAQLQQWVQAAAGSKRESVPEPATSAR
jgi:cholesterol transport system auxiliary component